ncbi:MAG: glycoside hydrolase family 13 protein [Oscillospiraceae bacterium]|nr:glycoside hydrolase family 13 protein [Oscillospiraceae bacterium]
MSAFDASKSYHKSIKGAVASGENLRLRVLLPRSFGVSYCTLILEKDEEEAKYIPMLWEQTNGYDEWWYIDLCFNESSLLFYHFEYTTPWGTSILKKLSFSDESSIDGTENWQLTVYPSALKTPDELKGGIFYQIFPDRFAFSGEKKNNVPSDRIIHENKSDIPVYLPDENGEILNNDYYCGDLKGIIQKLGYIKGLGANIIYLNPIAEAHSNHRYNTADYKKVDPLLGTNEDFKLLCDKAHEIGLKIVIDGVFSHTGDDSIYFNKNGRYQSEGAYQSKNSPYRSWYFFGESKDDYQSWWNIKTLPEVNEEDDGYAEFITGENGVIDMWMKLGADGIRLDVADELPDSFIERVRTAVKRHGENKLVLGEVWEDASNKISHGGRRKYFNGRQLDSVMNYPFRTAIIDFLLTSNAEKFMYRVNSIVNNYPPEVMHTCMNILGTHDTERILTALTGIDLENKSRAAQAKLSFSDAELQKAEKLLKMAVTINYFLPGIPSVYYGDETGMTGGKDPFNRGFFRENNNPSLTDFYIKLGRLRRELNVCRDGGFYPLSAELSCIAFLRYKSNEKRVAVIANNNPEAIIYNLNYDMREMTVQIGGEKLNGSVLIDSNSAAVLTD